MLLIEANCLPAKAKNLSSTNNSAARQTGYQVASFRARPTYSSAALKANQLGNTRVLCDTSTSLDEYIPVSGFLLDMI